MYVLLALLLILVYITQECSKQINPSINHQFYGILFAIHLAFFFLIIISINRSIDMTQHSS